MIAIRKRHKAFHPHSKQRVIYKGKKTFAVQRFSNDEIVTGYHNLSNRKKIIKLNEKKKNLLTGEEVKKLILEPYGFAWLS